MGASGAVYGLAGIFAWISPNFPFPIGGILLHAVEANIDFKYMLGAFMLLDVVGIMRGWKTLNHRGHLAGAACGLLYAQIFSKRYWPDAQAQVESFSKGMEQFQKDIKRLQAPRHSDEGSAGSASK